MFVSRIWSALEDIDSLKIPQKQPANDHDFRHSGTAEVETTQGTDPSWRVAMMFVIFFVSLFGEYICSML